MMDPEAVQRRMQNSLAQEIGQRLIELHEARAIAHEAQIALRDALKAASPADEGASG